MSNTLLMLCIPFAGLLLCIAVMPLVKPEWWEKHQAHAVILWSLLFAIPFALFYGAPKAVETVLECLIGDYLTFIVLLFGLFCVAGNIKLEGSLVGNPKVNVIMLAVGTYFSFFLCQISEDVLHLSEIRHCSWDFQEEYRSSGA